MSERFADFPGFVYIVRLGIERGPVKIGMSYDWNGPLRRIKGISQSLPWRVDVLGIAVTQAARTLEVKIHRRFKAKRMNGEWFQLDDSDIQAALAMADFSWAPTKPGPKVSDEHKALFEQLRQEEFERRSVTRAAHFTELAKRKKAGQ